MQDTHITRMQFYVDNKLLETGRTHHISNIKRNLMSRITIVCKNVARGNEDMLPVRWIDLNDVDEIWEPIPRVLRIRR